MRAWWRGRPVILSRPTRKWLRGYRKRDIDAEYPVPVQNDVGKVEISKWGRTKVSRGLHDGLAFIASDHPFVQQQAPVIAFSLTAPLQPCPSSKENHLEAFSNRVLRSTPNQTAATRDLVSWGCNWIDRAFVPLAAIDSVDQWLESSHYSEKRKQDLRRVYAEMPDYMGCTSLPKGLTRVKCFIKRENYDAVKFPRMILSRSDEAKCLLGPLARSMERAVYQLCDPDGVPYFVKHVPVHDRPALVERIRREGYTAVLGDYSAWEAHAKGHLQEIEFHLVDVLLQRFPWHAEAIKMCTGGVNACTSKQAKAKFVARRCSGEVFTSLFNGILNLIIMLYLYRDQDPKGFVEGDDSLFTVKGAPKTADDFAAVGVLCKTKVLERIEHSSFCGLFYDPATLQNMREPVRVLVSTSWTDSFMGCKLPVLYGLVRSKALSLIAEASQCPILGCYSRVILQLTDGFDAVQHQKDLYHYKPWAQRVDVFDPPASTRHSFAAAFGISIEEQLRVEALISASGANAHPELDAWLADHASPSCATMARKYVEVC